MSGRRLSTGGRIDHGKRVTFTFDGRSYDGFAGDTLASALLANGVLLTGRSFKYHRPRGILTAGIEEPNGLVTVGTGSRRDPNVPATMLEVSDGLVTESQNRWPSLRLDLMAINQLFAPLLSAGFYYKTFMGPTRRAWLFYEHFIRRAAGLGRASLERDPDGYTTEYTFADVAIVGSGPAGLSAALAAGRGGARVMLIEQDSLPGGQLLSHPVGGAADRWREEMLAALSTCPSVQVCPRTTAFGLYDGNTLGLLERRAPGAPETDARQKLILLRAGSIVFATGAVERPLLFANNDRPGTLLASAARTYLNRFAVAAGRKVLVATNNDSAYAAAHELSAAGSAVVVVDSRAPSPAADAARAAGVDVRAGHVLVEAQGIPVARALISGPAGETEIDCDLIVTSAGWTPTVHLTSHRGIKARYDARSAAFVPGGYADGHFGAGAITGSFSTADAIAEGWSAGSRAARHAGCASAAGTAPLPLDIEEGLAYGPAPLEAGLKGKVFVDQQNDVTTKDIDLAHREGFRSVEHLKRYTTLGMGTDQGKTSNVHAIALMAGARGTAIDTSQTTTFRPPYAPVAIGALAGRARDRHFKPIRRTPLHDWHRAQGAEMLDVGLWKRPLYYTAHGDSVGTASVAEMRLVREAAGMVDVSTLGKIEVVGPDATTFLDRVYVNNFLSLPPGKGRYCVMLRDDGFVFDEGVVLRLAEDRYFLSTSTARAADVHSWLEFLAQTAWPELRVHIVSVTDQWAMLALAGPRSRDVLRAAFPEIATDDGALPKMAFTTSQFGGEALRIQRVSYSGERAYELHIGARAGIALADHLLAAGKPIGIAPYGVDAMGALRIEKGFPAGGEIDGTTTLEDVGLAALAKKRGGYVGAVMRQRPALMAADRRQLVGLESLESGRTLRTGSILFADGAPQRGHGIGHVTAVTFSPERGKHIALALLSGGAVRQGETIVAAFPVAGDSTRAKVVPPCFLDPDGERLDA
jgi:sarcosine oxidase subunit alpha